VKRELRSLTSADKESFLDAAAEIWNNRQLEGEAKYGKMFTSVDTLVAVHSLASNDIMCDGFHEGTGFLTHHLALTNTFEAALRAINPSVTLPYWDFSIEGEAIKYVLHVRAHIVALFFTRTACTVNHSLGI
jgi:Common central domain of tyrosinase